ncbi:MFS transporter [Streptomyces sp. NPDC026673]|uniref:MFS transporter n=1 Tax=Streptomyces sp. NPDC026673 TaxID=3155724 RepID=UPI0033E88D96
MATALEPTGDAAPGRGRPTGRGLVLSLGFGAMVVSMMQTLVVPVLGTIQRELHAPAADVGWLTTATLLSAAVCTPLLGRAGDQYGRRPVLLGALALTLTGSVLAAVADTLPALIAGRALQGAATAVFPLAQAVLRDELPARRLPAAMGAVSGALAFGNGLALVGAGLLIAGPAPDYHRVFWPAVAMSALGLAAVAVAVPPSRAATGGRVDWRGALGLAATLVLLLLPLSRGTVWGWTSAPTLGCLAAGAVAAAVWIRVERAVADPLVDVRMLVHRPVLFANLAGLLLGYAMFSQFILVSALVQTPPAAGYGFGASVLQASLYYLLPPALVSPAAARLGGILVRRIGAPRTLAVGAVTGTAGFTLLATAHGAAAVVVGAGVLVGVAVAFGFTALPAVLLTAVPAEHTGVANGVNSVARSVGSSVAGALVATLVAAGSPGHAPAESRFTLCFALAGGAFALVAAFARFGMPTGSGGAVSRRDPREDACGAGTATASAR